MLKVGFNRSLEFWLVVKSSAVQCEYMIEHRPDFAPKTMKAWTYAEARSLLALARLAIPTSIPERWDFYRLYKPSTQQKCSAMVICLLLKNKKGNSGRRDS